MKSIGRRVVVGALLLFAYLALTGNAHPGNIVLGGVVTLGVLALLPSPGARVAGRPWLASLWAYARFFAGLAVDIVKCGFQVALVVLRPSLPIRPGILAIRSGCRTAVGTALSAHAITVTPGEMVVEIGRDGTLYTHCLDVEASAKAADAEQAVRRERLEGSASAASRIGEERAS